MHERELLLKILLHKIFTLVFVIVSHAYFLYIYKNSNVDHEKIMIKRNDILILECLLSIIWSVIIFKLLFDRSIFIFTPAEIKSLSKQTEYQTSRIKIDQTKCRIAKFKSLHWTSQSSSLDHINYFVAVSYQIYLRDFISLIHFCVH